MAVPEIPFDTEVAHHLSERDEIVDEGEDVVVIAESRKDENGERYTWRYTVYSPTVKTSFPSRRRARWMAALVEELGDGVTDGDSRTEPANNIPPKVAAAGKPRVATFLAARGQDKEDIAEIMDVSEDTVVRYLSRVRSNTSFVRAD